MCCIYMSASERVGYGISSSDSRDDTLRASSLGQHITSPQITLKSFSQSALIIPTVDAATHYFPQHRSSTGTPATRGPERFHQPRRTSQVLLLQRIRDRPQLETPKPSPACTRNMAPAPKSSSARRRRSSRGSTKWRSQKLIASQNCIRCWRRRWNSRAWMYSCHII
jgi:hypothetical protein